LNLLLVVDYHFDIDSVLKSLNQCYVNVNLCKSIRQHQYICEYKLNFTELNYVNFINYSLS
ncbi:hypothetical protein, partial [Staphylococcus epidermidis]|uniref:hypothetical protein n=1 Tax=Staphylococcus epidermidis TaxID=1282 RepID=UPI001C70B586